MPTPQMPHGVCARCIYCATRFHKQSYRREICLVWFPDCESARGPATQTKICPRRKVERDATSDALSLVALQIYLIYPAVHRSPPAAAANGRDKTLRRLSDR